MTLQQQIAELEAAAQERGLELHNALHALSAARAEHADMSAALRAAEEAAAAATTEVSTLAGSIKAFMERDARARRSLAHRAHTLREALVSTSVALRQVNDRGRREQLEVRAGRGCQCHRRVCSFTRLLGYIWSPRMRESCMLTPPWLHFLVHHIIHRSVSGACTIRSAPLRPPSKSNQQSSQLWRRSCLRLLKSMPLLLAPVVESEPGLLLVASAPCSECLECCLLPHERSAPLLSRGAGQWWP